MFQDIIHRKKKCVKIGKEQPKKLNVGKLKIEHIQNELEDSMNEKLDKKEIKEDISEKRKNLKTLMYDTAGKVLGQPARRN